MAIIFESERHERSKRLTTNFILCEEPSPNGKTREAVQLDIAKHDGLEIGDFVKADGSKVTFADAKNPTAAELKNAVGISLTGVSSKNMFKGVLSNQAEPYVVYIKGLNGIVEVKDSLLTEYLGIPVRDASTHAYKIPTEIAKWFAANQIDIIQCDY